MEKIGSFLKKFERLRPPDEPIRRTLVEVVGRQTGIELKIGDIAIRNSVAYINFSGAAKSQIFLSKKKILEEINNLFEKTRLADIR